MLRKGLLLGIAFACSTTQAASAPVKPKVTGDPDKGQEKSVVCSACHGVDGNSVVPMWPKLAGQHAKYLDTQLKHFAQGESGPRNNAQMYPWAVNLTPQDRADLAAYFESKAPVYGEAENRDDLELGQRIYHGGLIEIGLAACSSCHGPAGLGNAPANFPALAGQHSQYTYDQLKHFKSGERVAVMMNSIAQKMSDEQMQAVANYIQGLQPN